MVIVSERRYPGAPVASPTVPSTTSVGNALCILHDSETAFKLELSLSETHLPIPPGMQSTMAQ